MLPLIVLGNSNGITTLRRKYCVFSENRPITRCFSISRDDISVSVVT